MKAESQLQSFDVSIPASDGKSVSEVVSIMVPVEWDKDAQDWVLTPDAMELIEETKARHMGLLTPAEIRALREQLGYSQEKMSEVLEIGAKTWSRWETGRQRPSRSLNLLLKALKSGILTPFMLRQLSFSTHDWSSSADVGLVVSEPGPDQSRSIDS